MASFYAAGGFKRIEEQDWGDTKATTTNGYGSRSPAPVNDWDNTPATASMSRNCCDSTATPSTSSTYALNSNAMPAIACQTAFQSICQAEIGSSACGYPSSFPQHHPSSSSRSWPNGYDSSNINDTNNNNSNNNNNNNNSNSISNRISAPPDWSIDSSSHQQAEPGGGMFATTQQSTTAIPSLRPFASPSAAVGAAVTTASAAMVPTLAQTQMQTQAVAVTSAPTPSSSSFSSFYPKSGSINTAANQTSIPELPWTRRGYERSYADGEGRSDSRERRHKSSWHAALNKRLVAIESVEDLLCVVDRELNGFDILNTVTALNRLSRLPGARGKSKDPRTLEILFRIEAWITQATTPGADKEGPEALQPRHLASVCIGLARLQWKDSTAGRLLRLIGQVTPELLPYARPRDLSNMAWAFATLDLRGIDMLLLAIARECVVQISEFTEQNLSNTCWAFAKLGLRHDPLIKAIAEETIKKLPTFSAQGLSNTLWGFATMVIKGEEALGQYSWQLICALLEELMVRLPDCPTQQLSNSAWACCRLGVRHEKFMAAIASEGIKKLPDYTPQDLANTAMAFAKPNINEQEFLKALSQEAFRKLRLFEPREVSNIAWSLIIMGPGLLDEKWLEVALQHFRTLVRTDFDQGGRRNDGDFEGWEMVQLLNACWTFRPHLSEWSILSSTFRARIYGPVVRALAGIVGSGPMFQPIGSGPSISTLSTTVEDTDNVPKRLYNAGPVTSGALAAAACPPPPLEPLLQAREDAQRIIEKLQVDFLGPVFTRAALRDLGFIDPSDRRVMDPFATSEDPDDEAAPPPAWGATARRCVEDALTKLKAELPFMWFDRFGPHERRVQCWISYDLEVEVQESNGNSNKTCHPSSSSTSTARATLVEPGRIANFSLDEHRALNQHGQETLARLSAGKRGEVAFTLNDVRKAQQWLRGLFAQHDRAGHCERQALLEVTLEVVDTLRQYQRQEPQKADIVAKTLDQGFFDGSAGVTVRGELRMFVCHFYCISCLAALSNFARRFPQVRLSADYDDCWKTRLLDV